MSPSFAHHLATDVPAAEKPERSSDLSLASRRYIPLRGEIVAAPRAKALVEALRLRHLLSHHRAR
jgi:hypothetical protein